MFEPRGHQDMYGALVLPPVSPQAHFGVLFLHHEGYSMSIASMRSPGMK